MAPKARTKIKGQKKKVPRKSPQKNKWEKALEHAGKERVAFAKQQIKELLKNARKNDDIGTLQIVDRIKTKNECYLFSNVGASELTQLLCGILNREEVEIAQPKKYVYTQHDDPFQVAGIHKDESYFLKMLQILAKEYARARCVTHIPMQDYLVSGLSYLLMQLNATNLHFQEDKQGQPQPSKITLEDLDWSKMFSSPKDDTDLHRLNIHVDDEENTQDFLAWSAAMGTNLGDFIGADSCKRAVENLLGETLTRKTFSNETIQWDVGPSLRDLNDSASMAQSLNHWNAFRDDFERLAVSVLARQYMKSLQIASMSLTTYTSMFEEQINDNEWRLMSNYLQNHQDC